MIDRINEYIYRFNLEENQKISKFGEINGDLFNLNDNDYHLLYYFYPMIERLIRCILEQAGTFDLENIDQYTFKTLYSIFMRNEQQIREVFGDEFGEELLYYINETYAEDGLRNKIMHYQKVEIPSIAAIGAKYILETLIQFYVKNYCID